MTKQKMYLHQIKHCTLLLLFGFSTAIYAGEKENRIIDKAVEAYGGKQLTQLKNITLTGTILDFSNGLSGHSLQGAMAMYLNQKRTKLTVDILNKQKEFKQATTRIIGAHGAKEPTVTHRIFTNNQGYILDHGLQQFSTTKGINYDNVDYGNAQLVEPLIISKLDKERQQAKWRDTAFIQGQAHDVITVHQGTEQEYSLYLNQKTGHLTRMLKHRAEQIHNYEFLQHQQTNNITWAKQLVVSTAKQVLYYSDDRELSINTTLNNHFNIPTHYISAQTKQAVDASKLTIRELAQGIYFVGQDWGYTLFIDVGDYYISAGSWQMNVHAKTWQKSLDLLRKTTGDNKPIAQHLVSHHHNDHMMGLADILKLNTKLIIHPTDISAVKSHSHRGLPDSQFIKADKTTYLADGKVMIFDVPNSHASHNLVIYLPEHKLLFSEDMFGSSFKKAHHSPNGWPSIDTYHRLDLLTQKVKQLGLKVDQYISSHHARVLSQTEIDEALKIKRPTTSTLIKRLFSNNIKEN